MDLLIGIAVFVVMLLGLISIPFGFPGAAIVLAGILIYGFYSGFDGPIGPWFVALMCLLTIVAETADNWLTMVGARRYGASKQSMWLSFLGGLGGAMLIGGPLALVFGPFGPIVGGFVGAFGIVAAYEYRRLGNLNDALRAGWGTFLGRMAGILLKLLIAVGMITAVAIALLSRA
jgi:uncharacterized protein